MQPDQLRALLPGWRDGVEILIVAFLLYRLLRFLAGTRALQIVFGLLVLLAAWLVSSFLKFTMVTYLLSALFTYGVFAIAVVFQPELRGGRGAGRGAAADGAGKGRSDHRRRAGCIALRDRGVGDSDRCGPLGR